MSLCGSHSSQLYNDHESWAVQSVSIITFLIIQTLLSVVANRYYPCFRFSDWWYPKIYWLYSILIALYLGFGWFVARPTYCLPIPFEQSFYKHFAMFSRISSRGREEPNDAERFESEISFCRLNGDWQGVMRLIEHYSHIIERGDIISTVNHPSCDKIKGFYWKCLAEATFELKNEINNAIDCCIRSYSIDNSTNNARVIACRILLEIGGNFVHQCGYGALPRNKQRRNLVFTSLDPEQTMDDYTKVLL